MNETSQLFPDETTPLLKWQLHEPSPPSLAHSQESIDAAHSVKVSAKSLREKVFIAIKESWHGLTDQELCAVTGLEGNTVRPRRVELHQAHRIQSAGQRRTKSGRLATVWVVKEGHE